MANNHNDYEELSSLLYPSIEASGTGGCGPTEYDRACLCIITPRSVISI